MTDLQFYIHLIVSVSTIAMSGVVSAIVTYRLNKRRDDRQIRRQKLEEFYLAITNFKKNFDAKNSAVKSWMTNHISEEQSNSLQLEYAKKAGDTRIVAGMTVAIYFHELQPALDEFDIAQHQLNETIAAFRTMYSDARGEAGKRFLGKFDADIMNFEKAYQVIIEQVRMHGFLER